MLEKRVPETCTEWNAAHALVQVSVQVLSVTPVRVYDHVTCYVQQFKYSAWPKGYHKNGSRTLIIVHC